MAPVRKNRNLSSGSRTQLNPHNPRGSFELGNEAQSPATQRATPAIDIIPEVAPAAHRHRAPYRNPNRRTQATHTEITPQFLQATADQWAHRQSLTSEYDVHKRNRIDPITQQAVSGMNISRFVQLASPTIPTTSSASARPSLFHAGSPPEDLSYSLRNFVVADPVGNANVIYTRIAIKEGCTIAGYVPALPHPRCVVKSEEDFASEAGEEVGGQ